MKFKDKNIIVTGGSRGIGFAVAKAFYDEGARVLAVARNEQELKGAQKILNNKEQFFILPADVSSVSDRQKIKEFIENKLGGALHVLVNAAGIYGPIGFLEDNDTNAWEKTFAVNVFGTAEVSALVLPFMKKQKWGRIINFSGGGDGPLPRFTAYSASKGAIVRFTESLAAEVKDFNITVNAITPGPVNTKFLQDVLVAGKEKAGEEFYASARAQEKDGGVAPEKSAEHILYISGDEAKFISGKVISANRDNWVDFAAHAEEIKSGDIYNFRRIRPIDRGHEW